MKSETVSLLRRTVRALRNPDDHTPPDTVLYPILATFRGTPPRNSSAELLTQLFRYTPLWANMKGVCRILATPKTKEMHSVLLVVRVSILPTAAYLTDNPQRDAGCAIILQYNSSRQLALLLQKRAMAEYDNVCTVVALYWKPGSNNRYRLM